MIFIKILRIIKTQYIFEMALLIWQRIKNEWPKYILFVRYNTLFIIHFTQIILIAFFKYKFCWFGINAAAFTVIFVSFMTDLKYYYIRTVLSVSNLKKSLN